MDRARRARTQLQIIGLYGQTKLLAAHGPGELFGAFPHERVVISDVVAQNRLPAIQFVAEEAGVAGLADLIVVGDRTNRAIADHADSSPELCRALRFMDIGGVDEGNRTHTAFGHLTKRTIAQ